VIGNKRKGKKKKLKRLKDTLSTDTVREYTREELIEFEIKKYQEESKSIK
jgi:hypothetical protein